VWLRFVGLGSVWGGGGGERAFWYFDCIRFLLALLAWFKGFISRLCCLAVPIDGLCNQENLYQGFLQSSNGIRDQFLNHAWILAV